ncbi:ankyrin repeat domain-containing protein [Kiloniella antarctica]|uniref:Ankyrin repeat domain-containing protein n=1 Tax=Kiloniella antarctica TaxID=1550907 RepID=A0ABW5BMJ9_9PROT
MRKPIFGKLPLIGTTVLGIAVGVLSPSIAFADFQEGQKAFQAEDYSAAFRYWQMSADQGESLSQLHLARLYRDGMGTDQDKIAAALYYSLASIQNLKEASAEKELLLEDFTEEDSQLASKLMASWEPIDVPMISEKRPLSVEDKEKTRWFKAAEKGDVKVIEEMIESGFELNARDKDGWTALMLAALNNHQVTSSKLINANADLTVSDSLGMTALMAASVAGNKSLVEFMVKSGADIEREDSAGETAEYMAEQAGHVTVARYFSTMELPEDQVKKAQELLIALGYLEGSADGKSGPKTSEAVKNFQKDNEQKPTGLVRKLLLETLKGKVPVKPVPDADKEEISFESASAVQE